MTTNEYVECVLEMRREQNKSKTVDGNAAYEIAQLVSGSLVSPLYAAAWQNGFDMKAITGHLESMYESGDHFGLIYFMFILSDAVDFVMPFPFSEMSANDALVTILSSSMIEDWLDYDATSEVTEYTE